MPETVFAKIARGEAPARIVYEDDRALAFHDAAPVAPVHLLVVPRKPLLDLGEAAADDEGLLGHLLLVAHRVAAQLGLADYRVVVNNGAGAGQTIFHLHLHVIGGRRLRWPPG
jgi:histidine triad (HIT) family protein